MLRVKMFQKKKRKKKELRLKCQKLQTLGANDIIPKLYANNMICIKKELQNKTNIKM